MCALRMCVCGQCVGLRSRLLTSDETEMGGFQVESQAAPLLAKKSEALLRLVLLRLKEVIDILLRVPQCEQCRVIPVNHYIVDPTTEES